MHVVTIVSRNFLPRASVLARTHRQHNPHDPVFVLVVDAEPEELPAYEDFAILTPADLSLAPAEFERMALIYTVTELCTAVKPWALELLLDRGADVATYLDPDIAVYASLEEIEKLSLEHGIVLTPHTVVPMARDGLAPTEAQIMAAGTFNLGFLAVDQGSREMLSWWQERLLRDCITAPHEMLFVDQRWVDLVPGYFRHVVLTDPTYNVAYWNLDSRPLVRVDGEVEVAGHGPLHFFHFSGYEPERPWVLTKYHVEHPRVVLSEHPVVAELCHEYAGWITDPALGGRPGLGTIDAPYRFDRLPDGTRITRAMREALRRALVGADRAGVGHPPGWRDHDAVRDWFRDPVRVGCPTNRYLHAVWESRPDLQAAFPAPLGSDAAALLEWAWTWAVGDPEVVVDLLPDQEQTGVTTTLERVRGVNLAGYFTAELGVGEMGRLLVDGARAAGLPCTTVLNTSTRSRQQQEFRGSADRTRYPVTVAAVNADQLPTWARESDPALRLGYTIGMWAWEVEQFTGYDEALALVDEVWTLSSFSRDAIARATDKPVHVIPLPTREPEAGPPLDRAAVGVPEGPYLLFAFDYMSVFERKNPLGLVDAFRRAFPDGDGPTLVLKSVNGALHRSDRERLRAAVVGRSDVVLLEEYLDSKQLGALMDGCTAYVSLHRAEGYGLTLAEAMARGRPVVATAYSGNLDFMDESNALLVPHRPVPVAMGSGPYPTTTVWAEPDLDVAAAHLRWVVENPDAAAALGERAAVSIRQSGSIERTAEFVRTRVDDALERLYDDAGPEGRRRRPTRSERAIKQARREVKRPAVRRRTAWLRGFDQRQQGRFLQVLRALGLVRKRTDRALALAQENRRQLNLRAARTERLAEDVTRLGGDVARLRDGLDVERASAADMGAHLRSVDQRHEAVARDVARLGEFVRQFSGDVESSVAELRSVHDEVERLDDEQTARPYAADDSVLRRRGATGEHLGFEHPEEVPAFPDLFRGSEEFLLGRMRAYLPLLAPYAPVLDLGCGRGELLRLLREQGTRARGVDLDPAMVARAEAHGVDVTLGDGLAALADSDAGSWGAVVGTQVAEHLGAEDLRRLFVDARRALRPGGVLVVETVNPHSPAALKTFWLDLTHVRPLYPEALLVLAKESGYASARIDFLYGTGDLEHDLRTCGEYTLVATA
jgi:SAM-dependent methyltransferase/glycosyltransferase involved in cell wall biosynthesis